MYSEELRRQWVRRRVTDKRHFVEKTTSRYLFTRCGRKLEAGDWEATMHPREYYRDRYCTRCL